MVGTAEGNPFSGPHFFLPGQGQAIHLTEIPKLMADTGMDFLEGLLPWSDKLPEERRKKI